MRETLPRAAVEGIATTEIPPFEHGAGGEVGLSAGAGDLSGTE